VSPVTVVLHAATMDISEQFVPAGAHPQEAMGVDADRRRRRTAVVIHVLGGVAYAISIPIFLGVMALEQATGNCGGHETAAQLADARRTIAVTGLVWALLPLTVTALIRSLRAAWIPWALVAALTVVFGFGFAASTRDLHPLFCF
jgi:hypothetical protein